MQGTTYIACLVGAVGLVAIAFLATAIRIVQEYERLVVFRLGRCVGERGPGLVILIPFIERGVGDPASDLDHA
jgi:regulator of protease activity HflC (stomatin/prohibitin superfamily)